jgi:hypothetical protein
MTEDRGRKTKGAGRVTRKPSPPLARQVEGLGGVQALFAGRTVVSLLRLFILSPEREFYQRELAELAGERLFSVQKALDRLVSAGVVEESTRGNRVYCRANRSHPAFEDLKAVIFKTVGVGDALRTHLAGIRDKAKVAFIYGSVARGEETTSSDIDIMLIGDVSGRDCATQAIPSQRNQPVGLSAG